MRVYWGARWHPVLAVFGGLVLALAFTWPVVQNITTVIPSDIGDPLLQAWQLAWAQQVLDPAPGFWTANFFSPATNTVAFTDTLLGYLPLSLFGSGAEAAVVRYNVAYLFAETLAFVGGYALVRKLGAPWQAAAFGGVVFAWAPWRLAHDSHLNILSTGGIALAFAALLHGHGYNLRDGYRPEKVKPAWIVVGWLVAAWQVTIGFATGLMFGYALALVLVTAVVALLVKRMRLSKRVVFADLGGGAVLLAVTGVLAIPYLRVAEQYGFTRELKEVDYYSPPLQGLVTVTDRSLLWKGTALDSGLANIGETALFPGLTVLVLALAGTFYSAWTPRVRIALGVTVVVTAALAIGPNLFDGALFLPLWENLPGWNGLRTPGRLILWTILALIVLAAGAITRLAREVRPKALLLLPVLFALAEGIPDRPYAEVPAVPAVLADELRTAQGAVLVLPMEAQTDLKVIFWSIDGFPQVANGYSGWLTPQYRALAEAAPGFPNRTSVDLMRQNGITSVVVLRDAIVGGPYELTVKRPSSGLGLTRVDHPDGVVYRLDG